MKAGITYRLESKAERYERALREVGIEPVRMPPGAAVPLDMASGLVLTGGADINPSCYREDCAPETQDPDDARDEHELRVLREALAAGMPVLAICRGMQLFNVAQGGTLIQHLPTVETHNQPGCEAAHSIRVEPESALARIVGAGEHPVNSRHHQAVARPGDGLIVTGTATDGVIEAMELRGYPFAVAVQWHPEDRILSSEADRRLFEAFAGAVRSFSGSLVR